MPSAASLRAKRRVYPIELVPFEIQPVVEKILQIPPDLRLPVTNKYLPLCVHGGRAYFTRLSLTTRQMATDNVKRLGQPEARLLEQTEDNGMRLQIEMHWNLNPTLRCNRIVG